MTTGKILRHWPWWVALLLTTVVGLMLLPTFQRYSAIVNIEEKGGRVFNSPGTLKNRAPKQVDRWLGKLLGANWSAPMDRVEYVNLTGPHISDSDLKQLKRFPEVETISLSRTGVTDVGLLHLQGLEQLKVLELIDTKVTDEGLANLHGLADLKVLGLDCPKVTEAGIDALRKALPECEIYRKKRRPIFPLISNSVTSSAELTPKSRNQLGNHTPTKL